MKTSEIVAILNVWEDHHRAISEVYESLHALTGATSDCVLLDPVFRLLDAYDNAISAQVGDKENWLAWYAYENDLGSKRLEAIPGVGRKTIKIDSVVKLARCIK